MDEERLKRALPQFSCNGIEIYSGNAKTARKKLNSCLDAGMPVIVCVEEWEHWALIAGRQGDQYVRIDSAQRDVVGRMSWEKLRKWMACTAENRPYYGIAVQPQAAALLEHSLVHRMSDAVVPLGHRDNRVQWGQSVATLRRYFGPGGTVDASDFFETERHAIFASAGPLPTKRAEARLARLGCIAGLHRLRIPEKRIEAAVAGLGRFVAGAE